MSNRQKQIQRSWKSYFWSILLCVLLLPVYGIGLIGFLAIYLHRRKFNLIIKDTSLEIQLPDGQHNLTVKDLNRVELLQTSIDIKLNVGTLRITTLQGSEISFPGVDDPKPIVSVINNAIVQVQQQELKRPKPRQSDSEGLKPGGLEHMNDLVGLWQQGLIDDDAFEEEKKKFSKE
jgi:hypothetical protein